MQSANLEDLKRYIAELTLFMQDQGIGSDVNPKITLDSGDQEEAVFIMTGSYNPASQHITLFIKNRHPKDILRSYAHEFIHHDQNLKNQIPLEGDYGEGYAQRNQVLRNLEEDAFLRGNMAFRDWTDSKKNNNKKQR